MLKPRRKFYAQAKSSRPTSLTSFLIELLERLIVRYTTEEVLSTNPLSRHSMPINLESPEK